ncbi:alpha/beta hydrolase [Streptomyces sp. NPDC002690]
MSARMPVRASIPGRRRCAAALAAMVICSAVFTGSDPALAGGPPPPRVAVPQLDWRPCSPGSTFDCATAEVPLDYAAPGRRTIDLALVRRKATGPGKRIGSLLFNPGGPGGPGTVQMPQNYEAFPEEVRERFDIVSWDPRGIGHSTAVNCFGTPEEAAAWAARKPAGFPVGEQQRAAWNAAFKDLYQRCLKRDPELLRHVSTADSAHDLDLLRQAVGDRQLTYLGISYGTILGATYANLYPGHVRAMTLDSNIDPRAWTNHAMDDARLPTFLRMGSDTTAASTLEQFLTRCGATGTDHCAFSAGSPQATRSKFDQLMRRLREQPVGAWTYAAAVSDTVSGLYTLHPGWTELAGRLQDLWQGRVPAPPAPLPAPPVPYPYLGDEQAGAVLCGDSPNPRDTAVYPALEEAGAARTGDPGRHWTWAAEPCATWLTRAENRYTGPWNKPTAHPVLVVGTVFDPSTPYTNAQAMAEELADARLLTNTGYGHTALINTSGCVNAHESRYFIDGTLPPPGTTCRQDTPPFATPMPHGGVAAGGGAMSGVVSRRLR